METITQVYKVYKHVITCEGNYCQSFCYRQLINMWSLKIRYKTSTALCYEHLLPEYLLSTVRKQLNVKSIVHVVHEWNAELRGLYRIFLDLHTSSKRTKQKDRTERWRINIVFQKLLGGWVTLGQRVFFFFFSWVGVEQRGGRTVGRCVCFLSWLFLLAFSV